MNQDTSLVRKTKNAVILQGHPRSRHNVRHLIQVVVLKQPQQRLVRHVRGQECSRAGEGEEGVRDDVELVDVAVEEPVGVGGVGSGAGLEGGELEMSLLVCGEEVRSA
jgi:hypothetical protein